MNRLMACLVSSLVLFAVGCGEKMEQAETGRIEVASSIEKSEGTEVAMFGAGCFWGVEAAFRRVEGVTETAVGYAGGVVKDPTYEQVCRKGTGHAEVVQVHYDPEVVSYDDLLDVFWANHDPTQLNRQGPDVGDQYRSVIFVYGEEQRQAALASRQALEESGKHRKPIVTQLESAPEFYVAEDYHQQYLEKRGLTTCHTGLSDG